MSSPLQDVCLSYFSSAFLSTLSAMCWQPWPMIAMWPSVSPCCTQWPCPLRCVLCWCLPWGSFSVGSIHPSGFCTMTSGCWFLVRCNWQSSGFFSAAYWSWGSSGAWFLPVLPNHLKVNQKLPLCGILWLSWGIFFFESPESWPLCEQSPASFSRPT